MGEWEKQSKGVFTKRNMRVEANRGGWGTEYRPHSKRPWAAFLGGDVLTTKSGAVRTFASLGAAKEAAEKAE